MFASNGVLERQGKWELLDGNPHPYLKALQRAANEVSTYPEGRIPKAKRKSEFDRFASAAGARVPATFAFVEQGEISSGQSGTRQTLRSFLRSLPQGHYFCKPDIGMQGSGALHLEILPAGPSVNGEERDFAFVEATLSARPYLIQEWLVPLQHELARGFNPAVVNSVRLVTFEAGGKAEVVTGFFRSAIASRAVDNWNAGGVAVRVDLARGVLAGRGMLKNEDPVLTAHPVSGIPFDGHPVPHLREAIALVQNLHSRLRAKSLGWDIALLEDGPAVLECNGTGWDILIPSVLDPGFAAKFLDFHVPAHEVSRRIKFAGDFSDRDRSREFLCKALGSGRVSGRLDGFSEQQITVTVAGARRALDSFAASLKSPTLRGRFANAQWTRSAEPIRLGLDLSVSFLGNKPIRKSQSVMLHPGYEKRDEWEFFHGNPRLYLRSLLRDANKYHSDSPGRLAKPLSKSEFDRFVASNGGQVAETLALVTDGDVSIPRSASKPPLDRFLRELPHGHYFCKPDDGMGGVDAFHLENSAGGVKIGGRNADLAELSARLSTRAYLIQEWLVARQHRDVARFNPSVINAIRLGTFDSKRGPTVLTAFLKAAIRSSSVDNWSAGGVIVLIDRRRGVLVGNGILKHDYEAIPAHPVSGITFDGAPIPHFAEAVILVQKLHAKLRAKTLGWDIALLEHGPVVLECNFPGWDYSAPALLDPEFTAKFLAFHLTKPSRAMRFKFSGNFPTRDPVRKFICKVLGRSRLSGRLESLSQEKFTLTAAGSPGALKYLIEHLKLPRHRAQFSDARWKMSGKQIRPGLDLYASFSED